MTIQPPPISGHTRLIGIIGWPVEHSLSPAMHNAAFAAMGLDFVYVALPVPPERLKDAIMGIRALGLRGVNVTVPHKQAVLPYLDKMGAPARLLGAVNTIINDNGVLRGENTDGYGFIESLREEAQFDASATCCAIIGAGGSGRALAITLALEGAERLVLVNRTHGKAEALAWEIKAKAKDLPKPLVEIVPVGLDDADLAGKLAGCDLVVNATSLGMKESDRSPIPADAIPSGAIACDIVYTQKETAFLRVARERGCQTVHGLGMLLHQGARAFELWTGKKPDVELMRKTLKDKLKL